MKPVIRLSICSSFIRCTLVREGMDSNPQEEEKPVENLWAPPAPANWWLRGCLGLLIGFILLLVPAFYQFSSQVSSVKAKDGEVMAQTIASGAEQFFSDYNFLPFAAPDEAVAKKTDQDTDTSLTSGWISILAGREKPDAALNTRLIDYLEGFRVAREDPKQKGKWINGMMSEEKKCGIIDPWGKPFRVRLDMNGDGRIINPVTEDEPPVTELKKRVIIWSAGEDGNFETWDDNPRSWK